MNLERGTTRHFMNNKNPQKGPGVDSTGERLGLAPEKTLAFVRHPRGFRKREYEDWEEGRCSNTKKQKKTPKKKKQNISLSRHETRGFRPNQKRDRLRGNGPWPTVEKESKRGGSDRKGPTNLKYSRSTPD